MPGPRTIALCRRGFALALGAAAAYHAVAIVVPALGGSPGRHALFVAINLAFALGFWWPPRGFLVLVAALCVQQLVSHGGTLVRVLRTEHRLDIASVLVLIAMPLAVIVVALDARTRRSS